MALKFVALVITEPEPAVAVLPILPLVETKTRFVVFICGLELFTTLIILPLPLAVRVTELALAELKPIIWLAMEILPLPELVKFTVLACIIPLIVTIPLVPVVLRLIALNLLAFILTL